MALDRKVLIALFFGVILLAAPIVRAYEDEEADYDDEDEEYDDDEDYSDDELNQDDMPDDLPDDLPDEDPEDDEKPDDPPTPESTAVLNAPEGSDREYVAPAVPDAFLLATFQAPLEEQWTLAQNEKYNGVFEIGTGKKAYIPGDKGLIIPQKARFYGIATPVSGVDGSKVVLQYELRFDGGLTCSGAYLKLPTEPFTEIHKFDNDVPYSVMFGPDKCGATNIVHFIFQSKNPVTGKFTEHHLKKAKAPSVPAGADKGTHLFTVAVVGDSYEILVNNESKAKGLLSEDFEPPVQPPEEIDDPEDSKPDDWVDDKKIADPNAEKPEDWDEDAPKEIPDEEAEKPEGWLDNEPEMIPDPEAQKPEDWDDEEDGDWEAPTVANPACEEAGCGEWVRPMKANPDFKGKWKAPLIDNPEYKGEWKPRQIPNPEHYQVESVSLLPVAAVGIEIWVMDHGILFDNILLTDSLEKAQNYAELTWAVKKASAEEESEKERKEESSTKNKVLDAADGVVSRLDKLLVPVEKMMMNAGLEPILDKMIDAGINKPVIVAVVVPPVVILLMMMCIIGRGKKPAAESASGTTAESKKTDEPTADDPAPANENVTASVEAAVEAIEGRGGEATGVRQRRKAES